jgi:hypothetical protein
MLTPLFLSRFDGTLQIIQTFFVSAISGGITAELSNMLENPESILDLLANSLPAQSSYFLQVRMLELLVFFTKTTPTRLLVTHTRNSVVPKDPISIHFPYDELGVPSCLSARNGGNEKVYRTTSHRKRAASDVAGHAQLTGRSSVRNI